MNCRILPFPFNPVRLVATLLSAMLLSLVATVNATVSTTFIHDFGGKTTYANGAGSGPDGFNPTGEVAFDSSGNMYGTTYYGGRFGGTSTTTAGGVLWEITALGVYKDLHDFGGSVKINGVIVQDGFGPSTKVAFDKTGNLYGTAEGGGGYGEGILYRYTKGGDYELLHQFGGTIRNRNGVAGPDGQDPRGSVVVDKNGNFYGTTYFGGPNGNTIGDGDGMLWEFTKGGGYYDLHDFGGTITNANGSSGPDGTNPLCNVVFDPTGNMYGTASAGGPNGTTVGGDGMVWEITVAGLYLDLHDFGGMVTNADGTQGHDGAGPTSGLVLDSFFNLYGTTEGGGPNDYAKNGGDGILWTIEKKNSLYQDLHDFGGTITNANGKSGADGSGPLSSLSIDSKGVIYGTTPFGGPNDNADNPDGCGMVWTYNGFAITAIYTDVHDFGAAVVFSTTVTGVDGATPTPGISFDADGNMYGATTYGGPNGSTLGGDGRIWTVGAQLESLTFSPASVAGGLTTTGTVTLAGPAPTGGYTIPLSSNSVVATVPASVTIVAGATSASFTVQTEKVLNNVDTEITATLGTFSRTTELIVGFTTLKSVGVTPNSVQGSSSTVVTGTVTLDGPAPPGGAVINLGSSQTAFSTVPASVTIPYGGTSANFTVTHVHVSSTQKILIKAQYRNGTQVVTLTLTP